LNFIRYLFQLNFWFFYLPDNQLVNQQSYQHLAKVIRRLRVAVVALLIAVLIGTLGYRIIEGSSWFDAYYMSLITLSTVGYGEIIPLSHAGRVFTSFLIIFNLGLFAYAISSMASIFAEGGFTAIFRDYNMNKKINDLQRHTIVCGFGRHATEVCQELAKQMMPFVVIESDTEKTTWLREESDYLCIEGDATEDAVLIEAGIDRALALVVTLPSDANNLFIVLSARQINPNLRIISRANSFSDEMKIKRAGADHVVMPERIGGFYMATLINKPDLVEFFNLISNMGPSQVVFEEIPVADLKKEFQNRSIGDSRINISCRIPIVAVRYTNGQYHLNPLPEVVLMPDMHIVVLGDPGQMVRFREIAINRQ
jgi:voltage-gated potassium channel